MKNNNNIKNIATIKREIDKNAVNICYYNAM